jgi:hypothetical protein
MLQIPQCLEKVRMALKSTASVWRQCFVIWVNHCWLQINLVLPSYARDQLLNFHRNKNKSVEGGAIGITLRRLAETIELKCPSSSLKKLISQP